MKELKKQQQRLMKGLSQVSGSGSEGQQERMSAEISAQFALPLAQAPEKGILKNPSLRSENRRSRASIRSEGELIQSPKVSALQRGDMSTSDDNNTSDTAATQTSPEGIGNSPLISPPHLNIPPPPPTSSLSMYGLKPLPTVNPVQNGGESPSSPDGNIEGDNNSDSSIQKEEFSDDDYNYEQESDFEKDPADFESGDDGDADSFCTECQREKEEQELLEQQQAEKVSFHSGGGTPSSQRDSGSSRSSRGSISKNLNVGGTTGAKKLKNLDDLFKQLDQQLLDANSVSPCDSALTVDVTDGHNPPDNFFQSSDIEDDMSPENVRNSYMSCISPDPLFSPVLPISPVESSSIVSPTTPSCKLSPESPNYSHLMLTQMGAKHQPVGRSNAVRCSPTSSASSNCTGSPSPTKQVKGISHMNSYPQYHKGSHPNASSPDGQFTSPYSAVRSLGRPQIDRPNMLPIKNLNNPSSKPPVSSCSKGKAKSSKESPKRTSVLHSPNRKQGSLERMRITKRKTTQPTSGHSKSESPSEYPAVSDKVNTKETVFSVDDENKPRDESPPGYFRPIDDSFDSTGDLQGSSVLDCYSRDDNVTRVPPPVAPRRTKMNNQGLDGYPLCKRHSLTNISNDVHSNSEGYHSDKTELDDTIVVQNIPLTDADISNDEDSQVQYFEQINKFNLSDQS